MRFGGFGAFGVMVADRYDDEVKLAIELDREDDGQWIAEVIELPGVYPTAKLGRRQSATPNVWPLM